MKPKLENISISEKSSIHVISTETDDFDVPWHYHPECEITFIQKGRGIRFVGDNAEQYGDGDFVAMAPNIPHHWKTALGCGKSKAIIIQFKAAVFGETFLSLPETVGIKPLLDKMQYGIHFNVNDEIIDSLESVLHSDGLERFNSFVMLLSEMVELEQKTLVSLNYFETVNTPVKNRIDNIYLLVKKHFKEDISQKDFADKVGLTKESFSRYFRHVANQNFISYLNEYRISYATMLLKETDMRVIEVAYESGFRNLSNFNRQFKSTKGLTPLKYKEWIGVSTKK